jgi:cellulose synthase/poly-beta-1,6-N-acetylglucosamine synthase-like glycosyltransferase
MTYIVLLICAVTLVISIPVLVFVFQILSSLFSISRREYSGEFRPNVAVLMPAHNEAAVISETLRILLSNLLPGDRVLVIADNCTDETVSLARACGAEVVERFDAVRRGKGYALDYGLRTILGETSPPPVVVILDADCHTEPGAITSLAQTCFALRRPVQALYLMHSPPNAGLKMKLAEFALKVKNLARPLGYANVGLPCQLMGSGMAFLASDLAEIDLATGHIVEDLKMGLDFSSLGKAPYFYPDATVRSVFPTSDEGISSQRTRWEHGHIWVIANTAPRLILSAIATCNWQLLALVLDLCVPPLSLLVLVVVVLLGISGALLIVSGTTIPFALALANLMLLFGAFLLAWLRFGRTVLSPFELACVPIYILWKIPMYLRFMVRKQVQWVRTRRD